MNKLFNLIATNKGRGFFNVVKNVEEPVIYLYDVIVGDSYWGGIDALTFSKELASLDAPVIHLRINSPGGDVFAGRAIEQAIREHSSQIIVHVDGYAASAASYVALAGDVVNIAAGGFFMIHKAMTVAWGNADEMQKTVNLLNKIDAALVKTYAAETGQTETQLNEWLAAETWFDAEEALLYGFVDAISSVADKQGAQNSVDWDLTAYGKPPALTNKAGALPVENNDTESQTILTPDFSAMRRRLALTERG